MSEQQPDVEQDRIDDGQAGEDEASWQEPEPAQEPPERDQTHNVREGRRESEEG